MKHLITYNQFSPVYEDKHNIDKNFIVDNSNLTSEQIKNAQIIGLDLTKQELTREENLNENRKIIAQTAEKGLIIVKPLTNSKIIYYDNIEIQNL